MAIMWFMWFLGLSLKAIISEGLDIDHRGNYFMLGFLDTHNNDSTHEIIITSDYGAKIEIYIPFLKKSLIYNINAGHSKHVYLTNNISVTESEFVEEKGISILSTTPVSVYAFTSNRRSSDGFLVVPVRALSNEYMAFSYLIGNSSKQQIGLIGIEDNTRINVTYDNGCNAGSNIQTVEMFTMDKYEMILIICDKDITGVRVTSDKPIAVLSGQACVAFRGENDCDHTIEMVIPIYSHGTSFILQSSTAGTYFSVFRVIQNEYLTNHVQLSNGKTYVIVQTFRDIEVNVIEPVYMTTTSPVLVVEITADHAGLTATSMITVPCIQNFSRSYTIDTFISDGKQSYVTILADQNIMVQLPFIENFTYIMNSSFATSTFLATGVQQFSSNYSFGMLVYGLVNEAPYSYPAGLAFRDYSGESECDMDTDCGEGMCVEIGSSYLCSCPGGIWAKNCSAVESTTESTETSKSILIDALSKIPISSILEPKSIPLNIKNNLSGSIVDVTMPTLPKVNLSSLSPALLPELLQNCSCICTPVYTLDEDIEEKTKVLQDELSVEKEELSSTVRKKTSASDERQSASRIGYLGVVVLVVIFGSIIAMDIVTLFTGRKNSKM